MSSNEPIARSSSPPLLLFPKGEDHANVVEETEKLNLETLRGDLIRLEETIIFSLIERAQFKLNKPIYQPGAITDKFQESFLDFFLCETEKVHSMMRRYTSPDEHPFFPEKLLRPVLPLLDYPRVIVRNNININHKIKSLYIERILPQICKEGDDQQYGSSANCDIQALQALSKRIHYGKFVAEAKFQERPEHYKHLIRTGQIDEIRRSLTDKAVEERLLQRVYKKASTYGQDIDSFGQAKESYKVNPSTIVSLYRDYLIPLTIDVEVEYLLHRLDKPVVAFLGPAYTFSHAAALQYFRETNDYQFMPVDSIVDVFHAVLTHKATYGVVPVENSTTGRVKQCMDQLYETRAKVIGEVYLNISHNLIAATPHLNLSQIEHVYSHPQALQQCSQWLRSNIPNAKLHEASSTANAVELVIAKAKEGVYNIAAIGSALAAEKLGAYVLEHNIHDYQKNYTRFLVLGKHLNSSSGHDKTILTFGTPHKAGSLAAAINAFSDQGLNLEALEAFPNKIEPFAYNFYVEVRGHPQDEAFQRALETLRPITTFINIIGAFYMQQ